VYGSAQGDGKAEAEAAFSCDVSYNSSPDTIQHRTSILRVPPETTHDGAERAGRSRDWLTSTDIPARSSGRRRLIATWRANYQGDRINVSFLNSTWLLRDRAESNEYLRRSQDVAALVFRKRLGFVHLIV
jgi:hypothetical protein